MTDHDRRGAYTPPTDEPLHFDARRPRSSGGGTPPTTLLVSAVILLVLVGGAFAYYRSGVRHDGQAPAVVGTPVGDKAAAPASDQPQDPAAGLQVYNSETPQGAAPAPAPTLAPAPEEPLPRIAPPTASAPVAQAALPPAPSPGQTAKAAPKPLPVKPAPKVEEAATATPPAKPPVSAAPPAKAAPVKVASATGAALVQIGAFSSNSQADKGWNDAARVSPSKMLGKGKKVETVDKDGHTLYRTFVTGFASRDDAAAFCDDLKAAGKPCIVR